MVVRLVGLGFDDGCCAGCGWPVRLGGRDIVA